MISRKAKTKCVHSSALFSKDNKSTKRQEGCIVRHHICEAHFSIVAMTRFVATEQTGL